MRHVVLVAVVRTALSVHGAATEAHRSAARQVVVHREEQVAQQRAVDAVVPRGRCARERTLSRMSRRRGSCAVTPPRGGPRNEESGCGRRPCSMHWRVRHRAWHAPAWQCASGARSSAAVCACAPSWTVRPGGRAGTHAGDEPAPAGGGRAVAQGASRHGSIASPGLAAARRTPLV